MSFIKHHIEEFDLFQRVKTIFNLIITYNKQIHFTSSTLRFINDHIAFINGTIDDSSLKLREEFLQLK